MVTKLYRVRVYDEIESILSMEQDFTHFKGTSTGIPFLEAEFNTREEAEDMELLFTNSVIACGGTIEE